MTIGTGPSPHPGFPPFGGVGGVGKGESPQLPSCTTAASNSVRALLLGSRRSGSDSAAELLNSVLRETSVGPRPAASDQEKRNGRLPHCPGAVQETRQRGPVAALMLAWSGKNSRVRFGRSSGGSRYHRRTRCLVTARNLALLRSLSDGHVPASCRWGFDDRASEVWRRLGPHSLLQDSIDSTLPSTSSVAVGDHDVRIQSQRHQLLRRSPLRPAAPTPSLLVAQRSPHGTRHVVEPAPGRGRRSRCRAQGSQGRRCACSYCSRSLRLARRRLMTRVALPR